MRLFSCKVRVGGSLTYEVRKDSVTAPEIIVLRNIHTPPGTQDEVVVDIKSLNKIAYGLDEETPRTDKEERARLTELYGPALVGIEGIKHINSLFPLGVPLPKTVEGVPGEVDTDEPIRRTRVAKKDELAQLEAA